MTREVGGGVAAEGVEISWSHYNVSIFSDKDTDTDTDHDNDNYNDTDTDIDNYNDTDNGKDTDNDNGNYNDNGHGHDHDNDHGHDHDNYHDNDNDNDNDNETTTTTPIQPFRVQGMLSANPSTAQVASTETPIATSSIATVTICSSPLSLFPSRKEFTRPEN